MVDPLETMLGSRFAERGGVTADTVRSYERIGLLPHADRATNGYRRYRTADVERLRFIKQAQQFGLSIADVRQLLTIRDDGLCPCGHANELLVDRLGQIDEQIAVLQQLRGDIAAPLETDVRPGLACQPEPVPLSTNNRDQEEDDGWM